MKLVLTLPPDENLDGSMTFLVTLFLYSIFKNIYLFYLIYLFYSWLRREYLFLAAAGGIFVVACGIFCWGVWAPESVGSVVCGHTASLVEALRLSSCGGHVQLPRSRWDLNSPTRDRTHVPCVGRWILYHWTTREVPISGNFLIM